MPDGFSGVFLMNWHGRAELVTGMQRQVTAIKVVKVRNKERLDPLTVVDGFCYLRTRLNVVLIVISKASIVVFKSMLGIRRPFSLWSCAAWDGKHGTWMNPAGMFSLSLAILCID